MKIVVLGSGAMGSIIGAFLRKGGADVTLVDPNESLMQAIKENGLSLNTYDGAHCGTLDFSVATSMEGMEAPDVILLMCKTNYSRSALSKAVIGPNTYVFTCQNGLGNLELINEFVAADHIIGGSLNVAGTILSPGVVKYRAVGDFDIALGAYVRGDAQDRVAVALKEYLEQGGFRVKEDDHIENSIWQKAIMNVCNNAVTSLVRLQRVEVRDDENGVALVRKIAQEVETVAKAKGVTCISAEAFMRDVYLNFDPKYNTKGHYPSMAQDVMIYRRPTEIESANGAIVRFGRELGIPTPYNETIYLLVKTIEGNYALQYREK